MLLEVKRNVREPKRGRFFFLSGVLAMALTGAGLSFSATFGFSQQHSASLIGPKTQPAEVRTAARVARPGPSAQLLLRSGEQSPSGQQAPAQPGTAPAASTISPQTSVQAAPQRAGLNVVVLDPAHGGVDPGARGTGGIRESEIVLDLARQVRAALEAQGFQVVQTRQADEDPSFDDRSAMANAQLGAVFVTLHIASTGLPGTARVYVYSDLLATPDTSGLIPWARAQGPFLALSRKLGDLVQVQLAERFKGSPQAAQTAAVRQLRTTAAPAIAVELSSVLVEDRADLDRMAPGVADAIAQGVAAFRPSYVVTVAQGGRP